MFHNIFLALVTRIHFCHTAFRTQVEITMEQYNMVISYPKDTYFGCMKSMIKINCDLVNSSFEDEWEVIRD